MSLGSRLRSARGTSSPRQRRSKSSFRLCALFLLILLVVLLGLLQSNENDDIYSLLDDEEKNLKSKPSSVLDSLIMKENSSTTSEWKEHKNPEPEKDEIVEFTMEGLPPPRQYWLRQNATFPRETGRKAEANSELPLHVMPFDLSVNHLQRIELAGGALPEQVNAAEDYLPIVLNTDIQFRFRLKGLAGATRRSMKDIKYYRVKARVAYSGTVLWDSKKVKVKTMPSSIPWGGETVPVGTIVEWRVEVWDYDGIGPSKSEWSKFAVGPSHEEWEGEWITHPADETHFGQNEIEQVYNGVTPYACKRWKQRRPLPLVRAKVEFTEEEAESISSALLVMSGLGSFTASIDGKTLSSSSPLDPPLTDFSQRVYYRGFDVTSFFAGTENEGEHVIGVTLGSGWWDPRPLQGGIVKHWLNPRGSLTTVAELHVTYTDGSRSVMIPSGSESGDWQIAKGYIVDSDLFTGDVMDLGRLEELEGWDSPSGWSDSVRLVDKLSPNFNWVEPQVYESMITTKDWRNTIERNGVHRVAALTKVFGVAPIGKLIPGETPPVLPIERLPVEHMTSLGDGRWLLDFGKAISGVVRFDEGLPDPIRPEAGYPRAHYVPYDDFITVVYGDSLEMETGDINLVLVAGMGLHDGGPRARGKETQDRGGPCFPKDHGMTLTQRDVFFRQKDSTASFSDARQALFTTHGFRFAEVCCTKEPPTNAHALLYRTAVPDWGSFDSSNFILNGAYELSLNAFNSNLQGVQSDCPHREKLQYGGDLMANSPSGMHFFDMSAFYTKVIRDWAVSQWSNGAYTETTPWQDLNDYAGIGQGAGETVWASLPAVLTVRHLQHYDDKKLAQDTISNHYEWLQFLMKTWGDINWRKKNGLGDWLSIFQRDTFLTHHAYFMATARSNAYIANRLEGTVTGPLANLTSRIGKVGKQLAERMRNHLVEIYTKDGKSNAFRTRGRSILTPSSDLGLFMRIVPGEKRCVVLKNWLRYAASGRYEFFGGDEEKLFLTQLNGALRDAMVKIGAVQYNNGEFWPMFRPGYNTGEGIFAARYSLKTLSDMGFHDVALNKAGGFGMPSFEYMLSHNATSMWETWYRSEDVFSRNHPMLGSVAEWLSSSVAGVALSPTTLGGKEILFWPRIPTSSSKVVFASATQGTKRGDASIAWRFLNMPPGGASNGTTLVNVEILMLVPPSSKAVFRLPTHGSVEGGVVQISYADKLPDLDEARSKASAKCLARRKERLGFDYNWEFDREKKEWYLFDNGKAIGTPCESYLFSEHLNTTKFSRSHSLTFHIGNPDDGIELPLDAGLYKVEIDKWRLVSKADEEGHFYAENLSPFCSDKSAFSWEIDDASHLA